MAVMKGHYKKKCRSVLLVRSLYSRYDIRAIYIRNTDSKSYELEN